MPEYAFRMFKEKVEEDARSRYRNRLLAAVALKDFALAENRAPDPQACSQLNQLLHDLDSDWTAEKSDQLDAAIAKVTKATYPTVIDTVHITADERVRRIFKAYMWSLVAIGLALTAAAGWSYYSCRVAALGGDLAKRLEELDKSSQMLADAKAALLSSDIAIKAGEQRIAELQRQAASQESLIAELRLATASEEDELPAATEELKVLQQMIARERESVSAIESDNSKLQVEVDDLAGEVASGRRSIAMVELWPALLAVSLGALGACTYLLYRLIGAYAQTRMTLSILTSESLRLPVGAIVGWVVYVAFCQSAFKESFLNESKEFNFSSQSLLLMPFVAGYSSRLVVEILNRVIDGVRTAIGLQPETVQAAPPRIKPTE